MDVTLDELELLIEALERAAARLESMGRAALNLHSGRQHDDKAAAMRKLHRKLKEQHRELTAHAPVRVVGRR